MTRSLVVVAILCLTSTSALACMYDNQCEPGNVCLRGTCVRSHSSNDDDDVPLKRGPSKGITCSYDGDCSPGSRCIKGSGLEGVCLGG
jgi:hypothetical protein